MISSYICTTRILLIMSLFWAAESTSYTIEQITRPLGLALETPNWSVEDQSLYFVDFSGHTIFRLDGETNKIISRNISCGRTGLVIPLKGCPGYVLIGVQSSLEVLNFNSPDADKSKRRLTTVDIGKPGNRIHDAKVDANGNMWFGTLGKLVDETVQPDQATLYKITNLTYTCPTVALRPVTLSDGIEWSPDYRKMFYNDGLGTGKIVAYDYNMDKGEIANRTTFFDFKQNGIRGFPNGMTRDSDGNLWVATYDGGEVLQIDSVSGAVMQQISLPVDQVASLIWGGKNMDILYVTTSSLFVETPKAGSGSLFAITAKGCRGVPPHYLELKACCKS